MDAYALMLPLMLEFVNCFTAPGFVHFKTFITAHAALLGMPHCVTETLRLTQVHKIIHWTTPYAFMKKGRWSCAEVSQCLLGLVIKKLGLREEIVIALDDTLVKKWGKNFFGLGHYPDPTDKNPGAHKRRVLGHCWVAMTMLWERGPGQWFSFPLSSLLFVPEKQCSKEFPFQTKIELAKTLIGRLLWPAQRLVLVVDNLYAKAKLAQLEIKGLDFFLVSRLKSNARIFEPPTTPPPGKRGPKPKKGKQVSANQLWKRKSKRRKLEVNIYGKTVTIEAFVDLMIASPTLGYLPILVVIFPQRSGKKMNVFFATDLKMAPERLLELYAARFKIEDTFDELKTTGGFGDYRQRSFTAIKRHVALSMVAYSLLRLLSLTIRNAETIEAEPWWNPTGPPSVTRLRRAVFKAFRISCGLHSDPKPKEFPPLKEAA